MHQPLTCSSLFCLLRRETLLSSIGSLDFTISCSFVSFHLWMLRFSSLSQPLSSPSTLLILHQSRESSAPRPSAPSLLSGHSRTRVNAQLNQLLASFSSCCETTILSSSVRCSLGLANSTFHSLHQLLDEHHHPALILLFEWVPLVTVTFVVQWRALFYSSSAALVSSVGHLFGTGECSPLPLASSGSVMCCICCELSKFNGSSCCFVGYVNGKAC